MTHWYREPKRIKLMEHLERSEISFVLSFEEFSEDDLLNLRGTLQSDTLAKKLTRGTPLLGDCGKILIIAPREAPDPEWLENPAPWAGVFVLPAHDHLRERALREVFTINRSFHNGTRGRRAVREGVLHRFVLDMRAHPPSLYGARGLQPIVRVQQ